MKSQTFFGLDGLLTADSQRESKTREALSRHIDRKEREILDEIRRLPVDPTPDDLARYRALNEELLFWGKMRADHFPPEREPKTEDLLY
ncbi:hypothetical protein MCGE09_00028 [Thaumarchaeota archaeon SCGC AB-539-E09]|nr:hypothetical protein MCGE09_00028 [Thaumarchaeota archaeon SCGC AB-539-E09]